MKTKTDTSQFFDMLPGEEIICATGLHWKNYSRSFLILAVSLTLLIIRCVNPERNLIDRFFEGHRFLPEHQKTIAVVETVALVVFIGIGLWKGLKTAFVRYYITTKRIIHTEGLITVRMIEMLVSKCEVIELKQNLNERIFKCADIVCRSAAHDIILDDVPDAKKFRIIILNQMQPHEHNN